MATLTDSIKERRALVYQNGTFWPRFVSFLQFVWYVAFLSMLSITGQELVQILLKTKNWTAIQNELILIGVLFVTRFVFIVFGKKASQSFVKLVLIDQGFIIENGKAEEPIMANEVTYIEPNLIVLSDDKQIKIPIYLQMYHVFDHLFTCKTNLKIPEILKWRNYYYLLRQQYRLTGDLDPDKESTDHLFKSLVGSLVIGLAVYYRTPTKNLAYFVAGFFSFPWAWYILSYVTKFLLISFIHSSLWKISSDLDIQDKKDSTIQKTLLNNKDIVEIGGWAIVLLAVCIFGLKVALK